MTTEVFKTRQIARLAGRTRDRALWLSGSLAFSTIWAIVALILIYTVIATLYRQTSERGFDSLLSAHLFNLIGSVGVSESGELTGAPRSRRSAILRAAFRLVLGSGADLAGPYRRIAILVDDRKNPLAHGRGCTVQCKLPAQLCNRRNQRRGTAGFRKRVRAGRTRTASRGSASWATAPSLSSEIDAFEWQLFTYLSLFGIGMIAHQRGGDPARACGRWGGLREALAKVREGTAQRLGGRFPTEIEPLANETNALIENNRRIVERSQNPGRQSGAFAEDAACGAAQRGPSAGRRQGAGSYPTRHRRCRASSNTTCSGRVSPRSATASSTARR